MPNVKIYVDDPPPPQCRERLVAAFPALRNLLCDALKVGVAACQFAILSVLVMPDLPRVNVEMQVLAHSERTRGQLISVAERVQAQIRSVTGAHAAVRISTLMPTGYIALK